MILFIVTVLALLVLLLTALIYVGIGGAAFIAVFADVIVFVLIVIGLVKLFKKLKR